MPAEDHPDARREHQPRKEQRDDARGGAGEQFCTEKAARKDAEGDGHEEGERDETAPKIDGRAGRRGRQNDGDGRGMGGSDAAARFAEDGHRDHAAASPEKSVGRTHRRAAEK